MSATAAAALHTHPLLDGIQPASPPNAALDPAAVVDVAVRSGVLADVAAGPDMQRDLRALVDVARALGAISAANVLVPHALVPSVLLADPSPSRLMTIALGEGPEDLDVSTLATEVRTAGGTTVVSGSKPLVRAGSAEAIALVAARSGEDIVIAPVELGAAGVEQRAVRTIGRGGDVDLTLADVLVEPEAIIDAETTAERLRWAVLVAALAQAAEAIGMLDRALWLVVAHGNEREAFGKPLGTFQAFQHACADVAMDREIAIAMVDKAAVSRDATDAGAARAFVADAAVGAARTAVQLHGGAGFLDEHEAARLYRQAKEAELRWGSAAWHMRAIGRELLAG